MKRFLLLATLLVPSSFAQEAAVIDRPLHFRSVDVYVNSNDKPLAAYQVEVSAQKGTVKIVGIEGGEPAAFKDPPFYDPKAMQQERVILAAFNTAGADKLPNGKTRVATIHVQTAGDEPPEYRVKALTAASPDGKEIPITATLEERKTR
jgi:hypothetical protein